MVIRLSKFILIGLLSRFLIENPHWFAFASQNTHSKHTAQRANWFNPKSSNMYLLLITLEINSSGTEVHVFAATDKQLALTQVAYIFHTLTLQSVSLNMRFPSKLSSPPCPK